MRMNARAWLVVVAVAAGACYQDDWCDEESFEVKVSGTCAPEQRLVLSRFSSCDIRLQSSSSAPPAGLPPAGASDQARRPLREGEWQIYGEICPSGAATCAAPEPRRCVARRVEWRLELACFDGMGAPACHATMTE